MKVLHILDSLNRGGAETLELDLCRNARANGLDLVFAATGGGDLEDEFRNSGVEFVRFERRLPLDLKLAAQLRSLIQTCGAEIVHSHQAVEALHAYVAARGTRVKQVMSFHLCLGDRKNRVALKFLTPRMAANITVSRDLLECLQTHPGLDTSKNFHVIYNGVDAQRLKPTGASLRTELALAPNDLLLGMVGNFYPDSRKDQLTVCRALPKVFAAAPTAHFVFVGAQSAAAPEAFDECVRFCRDQGISDRVHFLGKRADVPDILNALDIFVLSSRHEGLPIAVIEAMMLGVPTVVSDIPALREVSGDGACAAIFRTGSPDYLAARLIELTDNPVRRGELGGRGKEWANAQFSIATHIARLRELYQGIGGE